MLLARAAVCAEALTAIRKRANGIEYFMGFFRSGEVYQEADVGVGCGPGGPPHMWHTGSSTCMIFVETVEELAGLLAQGRSIRLCGNSTKDRMGGPIAASDVTISTAKLNRVLQYEPRDLTISVEAGISYRELSRVLAEHGQMVPLDPAFSDRATVGGIVAANVSGPRRRLYGTARDMVIGMTFATLEGKLIRSGGMVVKNVAGLDMGKLMIGSFGTLAAVGVLNFRVHPMPVGTRSFVGEFANVAAAMVRRDEVLKSVLQPASIDLLNPM